MQWWFFLLAILIAVAIMAVNAYLAQKRRDMWADLAMRYGFEYYASDPFDIPTKYRFGLFQQGRGRKAFNCLKGRYGQVSVLLFDYQYTTGSGKNQQRHSLSGLIADLNISGPHLAIRPESFLDHLAGLLGFEDITFESSEFNRAFHVKCDNKKFAYDICHAAMMEFLLQQRGMAWELAGCHLLAYSYSERSFSPEDVAAYLDAALGFTQRIPEYVRKERAWTPLP